MERREGLMLVRFIDDDHGYRQWVEQHSNGFVVNSHRNPKLHYLILRCASCGLISSDKIHNYTTTAYIKTCSEDRAELENWAKNEVGGPVWDCRLCLR